MNDLVSAGLVLSWTSIGFYGFYLSLKWGHDLRSIALIHYTFGGLVTLALVAVRGPFRRQP